MTEPPPTSPTDPNPVDGNTWHPICGAGVVGPDRGIAALVGSTPVAVFLVAPPAEGGEPLWYAVDHIDPVSGAPVMARGIVGSTATGQVVVACPLDKRRYDLANGDCLDGGRSLRVYQVEVTSGDVQILTDRFGEPVVSLA